MSTSETRVFVDKPTKDPIKSVRYFLFIVSPFSWFKCFRLIFCRTQSRTRRLAILHYLIIVVTVLLMLASCYLFYAVTADSGQYGLFLSDVAANKTSIDVGRDRFDDLIWRTVLETFFLGLIFGLIQACNLYLAAQWRQRLSDRFRDLLFQSSQSTCNVLYQSTQIDEQITELMTNDIQKFTSSFATVLFGSMFFSGSISVVLVIVIASAILLRTTGGDFTGIGICFGAFALCILILVPTTQLFNSNLIQQSKWKGRLRDHWQRLQTNAECLMFYGSQRVELKFIEKFIAKVKRLMFIGSISFGLVNFPIQLLSALNGMCTYVIPTVLFFFLRTSPTPELAQNYLTAIPSFSFLITVLGQLLLIVEPMLITVTLGDRLSTIIDRLENLAKEEQTRLEDEFARHLREDQSNGIVMEHFNVSVPRRTEGVSMLFSDLNLQVRRGENLFICGPSGCGKTSLFRIWAGVWPVDARRLSLPAREHLIFIPQRPYLPRGSLRTQLLFLIDEPERIKDEDLYRFFPLVNLQYLLKRYSLLEIIDWSVVLSIGEQQRLAFLRLFVFVTFVPNEETLILFDESTSAIDLNTEEQIYKHLIRLGLWFVTISHRSSLAHWHQQTFHFGSNANPSVHIENQSSIAEMKNEHTEDSTQSNEDQTNIKEIQEENKSKWHQISSIAKFLHLPFQPDDRHLQALTIVVWLVTLVVLGLSTWTTYLFTKQTASLYSVLSDYASNLLTLVQAKQSIQSNIAGYLLLMIATPALFASTVAGGQILATLYTRRQITYFTHLLLGRNDDNQLLYHSEQMATIPNALSHDIAELNSQVFYLIFGHIYYTGLIGQVILAIILAVLLGEQNGGSIGVLVVYSFVIGFFIIINLLNVLFNRWHRLDQENFTALVTAHQRLDLQAEQIVLAGEKICRREENELREKLDSSTRSQIRAGWIYSIVVGVVRLSIVNTYLVNYAIPAAIFFHTYYSQGRLDPTKANSFITLSVYMYKLFSSWNYINYFGDPLMRIQSIGTTVVDCLDRLRVLDERHRRWTLEEQERGQRVFFQPDSNEPSIVLQQVDVYVPGSSHLLIADLNMTLPPTDRLIITGPSGCGKSTLLRLLAGLIHSEADSHAVLRLLPPQNTLFLGQRLHLIRGTLREQLSYLREARDLGHIGAENEVRDLLERFRLGSLLDRYSLDGKAQNWSQLLSIGEQQRLIMVTALLVGTDTIRLFVLDETTSGCDRQTEKIIYDFLQQSNVQYVSVSHRPEIESYHSHKLVIDPNTRSYTIVSNKSL